MDPFPLTWLRHAGNYGDFTFLAIQLVWDYHDWNETLIKFLLNNLSCKIMRMASSNGGLFFSYQKE
ncbi:hypothetical protein V3C99_012169 [Haemonchus contortus]